MGLFDFFRKKKSKTVTKETTDNTEQNSLILAMPMFKNNESYDIHKVLDHLKSHWGLTIGDADDISNETAVFEINGQMVAIAAMPAPIPSEEIESVAPYNYYWQTAVDDLKDHTGHAIVTVMSGSQPIVERYTLLSKMLYSILITSNCVGIYQGMTTQLFPRDYYLELASDLKTDSITVPLWIYFGMIPSEEGISVYTYGLKEFGKLEMEIIKSKKEAGDMYEFMINIVSYTIKSDVTFHDGETLGYTAEQKVPITISKGIYTEGQTIKLDI